MLTRRRFASAALGTAAAGAIAGCSAGRSGSGRADLTVQLSWLKDVSFAGTYLAVEQGYFADAGLEVELRAGGPNVVVPTVVAAGTALIGMASTDVTAASRVAGSELRIIGARFQRNPFCIVSKADRSLNLPADLAGKRIGVSPTNTLAFQSFLAMNGIPAASVKQVPVQFDVTPLVDGEVDGLLGYYTSQPNILAVQGVPVATMLLADFGYTLFENVYIVKEPTLVRRRDLVVGFMRAERRGWQDNLADPSRGVALTISKYGEGAGLDERIQALENESQNKLVTPVGGVPLLGMAAQDIAGNLELLRNRLKIAVDDAIFDTSVLRAL